MKSKTPKHTYKSIALSITRCSVTHSPGKDPEWVLDVAISELLDAMRLVDNDDHRRALIEILLTRNTELCVFGVSDYSMGFFAYASDDFKSRTITYRLKSLSQRQIQTAAAPSVELRILAPLKGTP